MPPAPAHPPRADRGAPIPAVRGVGRAGALAALLAVAQPAAAQGATTASDDAGAWSRPGPAVTRGDAMTLGAAAVAALALMGVDERVARWSQRRAL
jgi:hypothetical protein